MMLVDPDDDPEIQQLSIPIQPLIEELTCPICFNNIKDCFMTPCGHNFCSDCIFECVNRKHSCPCCNKATVRDNLVKNHHFDRLASLVTLHKEESSRKYFESIINAKVPQPNGGNNINNNDNNNNVASPQRQLSPIESLFHKHMKRSLVSYEEYYRELQAQHQSSVARVQSDYAKLMALSSNNIEKRDELMAECSKKTAEHDAGFEKACELLINAYDSYLKDVAPAPASLPVAVTLSVPSRKIKIEGIVLKPSDLVKDARLVLEAKMAERGSKLVAWSPANVLVLKKGTEEVILNEEWAVSQYRPPPGAEIAVMGEVQHRPPECFTVTYNPSNSSQTCDYYTCKDCKFNWICKNCAENCHRGHTVSVYIVGHRSTWACCYCPKNNKCTIQHSKSKK